MKKFRIISDLAKRSAIDFIRALPLNQFEIKVAKMESKRTLDQNAKLWAMLHDIAIQVDWYGQKLTETDWKDVFTAGLKQFKVVPGISGGFVSIGAHTSKMSVKEMANLIELIYAFGAEHGVKWTDTSRLGE